MHPDIVKAKIDMLTALKDYSIAAVDFEPILSLSRLTRVIDETIYCALFDHEGHYTDVIEAIADSDDFGLVSILGVAYQIVEKVYAEAVETNMYYKDAYKLAKARVEEYAAIVGKSPIYMLDQQ